MDVGRKFLPREPPQVAGLFLGNLSDDGQPTTVGLPTGTEFDYRKEITSVDWEDIYKKAIEKHFPQKPMQTWC